MRYPVAVSDAFQDWASRRTYQLFTEYKDEGILLVELVSSEGKKIISVLVSTTEHDDVFKISLSDYRYRPKVRFIEVLSGVSCFHEALAAVDTILENWKNNPPDPRNEWSPFKENLERRKKR